MDSQIIDVIIDKDENTISVVYRQPSNIMLTSNPPKSTPDKVWKEVYGVVDGKITQTNKIIGIHKPAKFIEEKFVFDE